MVKQYSQHMTDVFRDRNLRIFICDFALQPMCDFLIIFADGMDQAHWRLPRDPLLREVKSLQSFVRPTVIFECVWIYGYRIDYYLFDTDQAHDSSSIIECIS
eukprot:1523663-Alexandrium_andersonii.AAC.1